MRHFRMTTCEAISKRIYNLMAERGMTLYRLSQNSGASQSALQFITKNKIKSVTLSTIIQIASGFDMQIWDFLNDPLFKESNFDF